VRYMGGKARLAKHIVPLLSARRKANQVYVEPFLGGANVFSRVDGPKIGADANQFMIAMWQAAVSGWVPPRAVTLEEYRQARTDARETDPTNRVLPDALIGFIGAGVSFGGRWFEGYARPGKRGGPHPADESSRVITRQVVGMRDSCWLVAEDYAKLPLPPESLIYCDPPYAGTKSYGQVFDSAEFWRWAEGLSRVGHTVLVSEYAAPEGWSCIWEQERDVAISARNAGGVRRAVERIFVIP
jgi:DNA adenine methylase